MDSFGKWTINSALSLTEEQYRTFNLTNLATTNSKCGFTSLEIQTTEGAAVNEFSASFDSLGTGVIVLFDATNYYGNLKTYNYQLSVNASGAIMTWPIEIEVVYDCASSAVSQVSYASGTDI